MGPPGGGSCPGACLTEPAGRIAIGPLRHERSAMTLAIDRNDPAIRAHQARYAAAMAAKRRQTLIGAAVLALLIWLAAIGSEVDLEKFAANAWRFPKYILETVPVLRWQSLGADLAEWYWGWKGWLKLLWQTILIAYVGTL